MSFSPTISPLKFHVTNKQNNELVPIMLDTENHNNAIKVFVPGSDVFFQALKLLHIFYEDFNMKFHLTNPNEIWRNNRLSEKLAVQLSDDIAIVSGAIPEWCDAIVCHSPYLFPLDLRVKYFRCTTFGMSRAAAWIQSHSVQNNSQRTRSGSESSPSLRGLGGSNRTPFLQISKETVTISRENLLESSDHMMALTANQSLILEVRFKDEKGIGIGVTASFYTALAQELLLRKNNRNIPLWIDEDRTGDDENFLTYTFGVFPQPISDHFDKKEPILQRFKLLGRIVGRALLDEHVFPLCFSAEFLRLAQAHSQFRYFKQDFTHIGQQDSSPHQLRLRVSEIPKIYQNTGIIFLHLHDACERRRIARSQFDNGQEPCESPENIMVGDSGLTIQEWLQAASLVMADPSSGLCLYPGGEEVAVTIDNVDTYIQMVLDLWCYNGIIKQIDAFLDGLSSILLTHKLCIFSPHELQVLIRGVNDFDWTIGSLEQQIVLGHGYTNESEPFRLLLVVLSEMTQEEKMDFIAFVTGCPHLPPGGLQSLKPPLEICRRQPHTGLTPLIHDLWAQFDDVNQQMPFARTCTHTLHLPPYNSSDTLKKNILFAARNSMNLIDRD